MRLFAVAMSPCAAARLCFGCVLAQKHHGAEVRRAERQRVQELQRKQQQRPADRTSSRSSARCRPPRRSGSASTGPRRVRQARREGEQHDLGDDAERPQHADRQAVESLGGPVERREAVVDRVACLDQASGGRDGEERGLAQMAVTLCPRGWRGRRDRVSAARATARRAASAQLPAKITQIRLPGASTFSSSPPVRFAAMKATEPHSRTGP